MSATKTLAFILGTQDYRDTSLLVHFYTRDFGKVRGIVKGVRDARGRYGSTLEPFSLNEILFYRRKRGGDLHQVTQVDLTEMFPVVREDLERLSYASYFAELLNQLVETEEPSPETFDLLQDSLIFLASGASPKRCARVFETKLLDILGFMPEIKECVVCRVELPSPAFFSVAAGGIRCKDCAIVRRPGLSASENSQSAGANIPVSRGALNFLDRVRRSAVKDLYPVKVAQEVGEEVEKILRRFVQFHLPAQLKSVVFLEKMGFN